MSKAEMLMEYIVQDIVAWLMDEEHISSGTELSVSEINWFFVPYNIEHTGRRNELIKVLKKLKIYNLLIL